jgi:GT2 family glycosyltransferase
MKIHCFTLSWNGADKLQKLRKGASNNLGVITHENGKLKPGHDYATWYIRDNGSKDNTANIVNTWNYLFDHPVDNKLFQIDHNRDNFAKGMNYLFEQANPKDDDIILLLNNDVVFNDTYSLKNMFDLLMKDDIGAVGARLLYTGTNKLQHSGIIFGKRYGLMPYHLNHNEESNQQAEKNRYFQAVTGAVCLIKASEFRKVNGFDENFSWAFDDVDLCLKIGQTKKIAYCGKTNIFHEESASLKKNPVNKLFLNHNVSYFKQKWFDKYIIDHDFYLNDSNHNVIRD